MHGKSESGSQITCPGRRRRRSASFFVRAGTEAGAIGGGSGAAVGAAVGAGGGGRAEQKERKNPRKSRRRAAIPEVFQQKGPCKERKTRAGRGAPEGSSSPRERQNAAREDSIAEGREKRKGQSVTNDRARVRTREGGGPQALRAQAFQPFTVERRRTGRHAAAAPNPRNTLA